MIMLTYWYWHAFRTHALQLSPSLFHHLVGAGEQ